MVMLPSRSSQQFVSAPQKHKPPLPQEIQDIQRLGDAGEQQYFGQMTEHPEDREITPDLNNDISAPEQDAARLLDARKQKRFTLTLPIQSNFLSLQASGLTSPIASAAPSQTGSDDAARPPTPSDTNFLTAIAAQERRVLELKEELIKAEQALHKLKKEWAIHEVHKKRQDIRRMKSTRNSANTPAASSQKSAEDSIEAHEAERRRAMHYNSKRASRTVFSGSKHARTLSLLSPEPATGSFPPTLPQEREVSSVMPESVIKGETAKISHKRVVSGEMQRSKSYDANSDLDLPREVLMRAGRQMATDFKDGLWTFLEDLRQVTVGEEVPNAPRARAVRPDMAGFEKTTKDRRPRTSGSSSQKTQKPKRSAQQIQKRPKAEIEPAESVGEPSPKDSAVGFDDQPQHGEKDVQIQVQDSPITRKTPRRRSVHKILDARQSPEKAEDGEGWDSWDSPQGQPTSEESQDQRGKDMEAVSLDERRSNFKDLLDSAYGQDVKRDPIPWPALGKLAPSNLRRTASHLMSEWEKSISPHSETRGTKIDGSYFDNINTMAISPKID